LESRTAPPDNAAPLYFTALAEVSTDMYSSMWSKAKHGWPWERATMPAHLKALEGSIGKLADRDKLQSGSVPQAEIDRVLADSQPALQRLDRAQEKPHCVFVTGLRVTSIVSHAMSSRQFGRLATIEMYRASQKADFNQAEKAVRRTLRLSRDLRPRGLLVCQVVSITLDNMVLAAINDFTLGARGLDAKQCDRLLSLLIEHQRDPISPVQEALRCDYLGARYVLDDIQQGRLPLADFLRLMNEENKAPPKARVDELMKSLNWEAERAAMNRAFAAMFTAAARPYHEILPTKWEQEEVAKLRTQNARITLFLFPAVGAVCEAAARGRAHMAGTQCLIAVRRYVLVHGAPPPDLDTACREAGLAAVPVDPFSGQPMRYKVIDSNPVVYSVGRDQKDDGGLIDWQNGTQAGDFIFRLRR
jgi:hypothetical protein